MVIREVTLPLRLVTLENQREHWAKKAKRAKEQRSLARLALGHEPGVVAYEKFAVTLRRVAPRMLDEGNYQGCFKHVQDGVADWLGLDDGDPRIEWRYEQERGRPRWYACKVRIERKSA